MFSASAAAAKGSIPRREYAVITGPGLSHPIVFTAPWKRSTGGFVSGEGELFLGLACGTGAIPAGRTATEASGYVPDGVLPIDYVPSQAARGPRFRLTWFREGVKGVAKQYIYPYAPAGPLVYTFPSSRRALIVLFGRFQAPAHLWTGWGRATTFDLKQTLLFYGLPDYPLKVRAGSGNDPLAALPPTDTPPATGSTVAATDSAHVLTVAIAGVILLATFVIAFLWMWRRSFDLGGRKEEGVEIDLTEETRTSARRRWSRRAS